jgi:hypothetical protein
MTLRRPRVYVVLCFPTLAHAKLGVSISRHRKVRAVEMDILNGIPLLPLQAGGYRWQPIGSNTTRNLILESPRIEQLGSTIISQLETLRCLYFRDSH